jgi:hypothetical protein
MCKKSISVLKITLALLLLSTCTFAQEAINDEPIQLSDYRIVQYISSKGYSPISITRLDNNGDILLACRYEKTKEQLLEMGINITDSQLRLLEIYRLLSKKDNVFKTAIPILDTEQTSKIRKYSKDVSKNLIQIIRSDVIELVDNLEKIGREKNAYSILFAYIFDGMSWSEFYNKGLVQSTNIDIDHPFWAGEVYAFYPDRSFTSGTNTWSEGPFALKINWSRFANPYLSPFYKEIKNIDDTMFRQILESGFIEDESVREAFDPFGIIDEKGSFSIPIIDESEDNKIYLIARKIATEMTDNTLKLVSFDNLKNEFDFRDINQAIIIFYHELIWDLMDSLEEQGIVKKPVAFTNDESVTTMDIADLMFIVRASL